jgi:NAD+ diphosphatase
MPDSRPPRPNPLSNPAFDRAAHLRLDEGWMASATRGEDALIAPVWQSRSLIATDEGGSRAALIPSGRFDWDSAGDIVFLGRADGRNYFAADIAVPDADDAAGRFAAHGAFEELRLLARRMPGEEAALLAYAKGMLWWHERHRFCGVCGHPTVSNQAGHRRVCTNEVCRTEQFPRSDPAVIMLIEHEDRCLLARGARFPDGFWSVLAGFVEPGESIEDTVAREVFEECGIRIADITYQSSQPWPFPSSLMMGFRARALNTELTLDPHEIVEAGWFDRGWIRSLDPDGPIRIPPKLSISRRLIDDWMEEG